MLSKHCPLLRGFDHGRAVGVPELPGVSVGGRLMDFKFKAMDCRLCANKASCSDYEDPTMNPELLSKACSEFKPMAPKIKTNGDRIRAMNDVEVIHGEWRTKILCGGFAEEWGYVCSVCGCTVSDRSKLSFGKFATGNQKLNYCPNCSAKMDLKVEA